MLITRKVCASFAKGRNDLPALWSSKTLKDPNQSSLYATKDLWGFISILSYFPQSCPFFFFFPFCFRYVWTVCKAESVLFRCGCRLQIFVDNVSLNTLKLQIRQWQSLQSESALVGKFWSSSTFSRDKRFISPHDLHPQGRTGILGFAVIRVAHLGNQEEGWRGVGREGIGGWVGGGNGELESATRWRWGGCEEEIMRGRATEWKRTRRVCQEQGVGGRGGCLRLPHGVMSANLVLSQRARL